MDWLESNVVKISPLDLNYKSINIMTVDNVEKNKNNYIHKKKSLNNNYYIMLSRVQN